MAVSVAAPSTSLLPIQALTNVGCAARIAWICERAPRMSSVSALAEGVGPACIGSNTVAPGTATLLM